jgi:hypothetical protein
LSREHQEVTNGADGDAYTPARAAVILLGR